MAVIERRDTLDGRIGLIGAMPHRDAGAADGFVAVGARTADDIDRRRGG